MSRPVSRLPHRKTSTTAFPSKHSDWMGSILNMLTSTPENLRCGMTRQVETGWGGFLSGLWITSDKRTLFVSTKSSHQRITSSLYRAWKIAFWTQNIDTGNLVWEKPLQTHRDDFQDTTCHCKQALDLLDKRPATPPIWDKDLAGEAFVHQVVLLATPFFRDIAQAWWLWHQISPWHLTIMKSIY